MDLAVSATERDFRHRARTWLEEHVPGEAAPDDPKASQQFELAWQRLQYDAGWAGVNWPVEYGGLGLSLTEQLIWYEEYALAGAPQPRASFVGLRHAGPTLILRGTDAQKAEHLPRILRGELTWCQGFSEPGAGSDLAGLRTRAVVDGDHLVVSGQKIWTSYADVATYQELLVRTDPEAPKHRGISWVICDMGSPGIEVRPIRTLAGVSEFCEVFYDEVRIPLANVVGELNDGWSVAMSTLSFERGTAFMAEQVSLARTLDALVDVARVTVGPDGRRPAIDDEEIARRLGRGRSEVSALRAMTLASVGRAAGQPQPGPEASMIRVLYGELEQRITKLAVDIVGPEGAALVGVPELAHRRRSWTDDYLWSFQATIAAGSKDIQRNIIGERVLGLPR
ncbi:MAG TPA: acyl-CoA dehydrogenase family protein [Acidimicrobiales bacterium]|nr:acyl-CoA dehydrogenase family protein [Acidimicrobiales bacterium]